MARLYPPLTKVQKGILQAVITYTRLTRYQIAYHLDLEEADANSEITSLIIRGALVADAADSDLFLLGRHAALWMSKAVRNGVCDQICRSCGMSPCAMYSGHVGVCHCDECRSVS